MNDIPIRTRQKTASSSQADSNTADDVFETYSKSAAEASAESKLLQFVDEQITNMQKYSSLGNTDGMPGFYELNTALMQYNTIQCSLISMDVLAKQDLYNISEEFDQWLSEKYLEARSVLNPTSLSAQKWASAKELEMWVRVTYKQDYSKYATAKHEAEMKVAFLRRLLDAWNTQATILSRLSRNIEVEATQLKTTIG